MFDVTLVLWGRSNIIYWNLKNRPIPAILHADFLLFLCMAFVKIHHLFQCHSLSMRPNAQLKRKLFKLAINWESPTTPIK